MAELRTMYPPQKDSPSTFLLGDISATDVLMMVANAALLPQTFPYPLTVGIDRSITETVMVTACNLENNQLTIIRGSNAISWTAGVKVGRVFRAQDLEDIQENIKVISAESEQVAELIPELETTIADNTEAIASTTADLTTEVARAKKAESDEATRADTEEKRIDAAKPERSELVQVITGCECDAVNDEVTLEFTRYNSVTKQVSTFAKMLPIVTGQSAGLMSVGMYDIIGDLRDDVEGKLDKPTSTTSGNLATFDASGEVTDSGKKASDFATATDLTAHTGNTANPHSVTAAQAGADPAGTAASAVSAHNGAADAHTSLFAGKSDAGHTHDNRYYTETETDTLLAGKADSSHNHSAADITSGTLPLTRGGTGQTTAAAAATALGRGYGTCATAATTVAKVGTLSGFVLNTGAVVGIKFTYANTTASPTLNVNSTGAKAIYNYLTGAAVSDGDITAGMTALFQYNGTQWVLLNPKVKGGMSPRIVATAPTGSAVTCSKDATTLTATEAAGTWTFDLPDYGTWTVTATLSGQTATESVVVDQVKLYSVALAYYHIYGVEWDGTSSTALSRTDDAELFADPSPAVSSGNGSSPFDSLLPWSGMVKETRNGSVMVKIPKFWFKWTKTGSKLKLQIADAAVSGFSVSPAHMDRGDGTGERDIVYVARHHCNSSYLSGTGNPVASITRSAARSSIHAKGTKIWQMDYAMRLTIQMLYLVEYADWNSQAKIGYGCGNNSAAQAMGYTDSMTYHTGTTQASRTTYGLGTQYRWIEGLWDNVHDWMDGCYYNGNGLNIIKIPANFSDTANGTAVGTPITGYPSVMNISTITGFEWVMYPTTASGSESTYVPDYWVFGASGPCLDVGGSYSQVQDRGLFYVGCNGASVRDAQIGCRLQELP